jgi:hypothetical protein
MIVRPALTCRISATPSRLIRRQLAAAPPCSRMTPDYDGQLNRPGGGHAGLPGGSQRDYPVRLPSWRKRASSRLRGHEGVMRRITGRARGGAMANQSGHTP